MRPPRPPLAAERSLSPARHIPPLHSHPLSLSASSTKTRRAAGVGADEGRDAGTATCPKSLLSMPEGLAERPFAGVFFMGQWRIARNKSLVKSGF